MNKKKKTKGIKLQKKSNKKKKISEREYLWNDSDSDYYAKVVKIDDKSCVLKNVWIDGMRHDGMSFNGSEDHINLTKAKDIAEIKKHNIHINDKIRFKATVYEYTRKDGSKDFSLKDIENIYRIEDYKIPTREELIDEQIWNLVCETCLFNEKCCGLCLADESEMKKRFKILKDLQPGKFTPLTVLAAYEIWGKAMTLQGWFNIQENDPNYELIKKIEKISAENNSCTFGSFQEAMSRMLYPEFKRIYFE